MSQRRRLFCRTWNWPWGKGFVVDAVVDCQQILTLSAAKRYDEERGSLKNAKDFFVTQAVIALTCKNDLSFITRIYFLQWNIMMQKILFQNFTQLQYLCETFLRNWTDKIWVNMFDEINMSKRGLWDDPHYWSSNSCRWRILGWAHKSEELAMMCIFCACGRNKGKDVFSVYDVKLMSSLTMLVRVVTSVVRGL